MGSYLSTYLPATPSGADAPDVNPELTLDANWLGIDEAVSASSSTDQDYQFYCHGATFKIAKTVLMRRSEYFRALFESKWQNGKDDNAMGTLFESYPLECITLLVDLLHDRPRHVGDKSSLVVLLTVMDKYCIELAPNVLTASHAHTFTRDESLKILKSCKSLIINDDYVPGLIEKSDALVLRHFTSQDVAQYAAHLLSIGTPECFRALAGAYSAVDSRDLHLWSISATPEQRIRACTELAALRATDPMAIRMDMCAPNAPIINLTIEEIRAFGTSILPYIPNIYVHPEVMLFSPMEHDVFWALHRHFYTKKLAGCVVSLNEEILMTCLAAYDRPARLAYLQDYWRKIPNSHRRKLVWLYIRRCESALYMQFGTNTHVYDIHDEHFEEVQSMVCVMLGGDVAPRDLKTYIYGFINRSGALDPSHQ